jgi:hypothetical protein
LNFRARHIEIDHKRRALVDLDRDRESDRDHVLSEEWRLTRVTGAMFPTAMRRSALGLGAECERQTSIPPSLDAGQARLISTVLMRLRCRKNDSVPGWRVLNRRLTAVGLRPRGSGPLLTRAGPWLPASSPALGPYSRRLRALTRTAARRLDDRSIVLGWTARDHCVTAAGLRLTGSGPLLKPAGLQPPAGSAASARYSRRSRALTRTVARRLDNRSVATQRRKRCSNEDCLVGFRRPRRRANCERRHHSAA